MVGGVLVIAGELKKIMSKTAMTTTMMIMMVSIVSDGQFVRTLRV